MYNKSMKKINKIEFFIPHRYQKDGLVESKKHIPNWYKDSKKFLTKREDPASTKGLKLCAPFLDSLTTGYMLELTQDIRVGKDLSGQVFMTWNDSEPGGIEVLERPTSPEVPAPHGFLNTHYAWKSTYNIRLPKGYSALFVHPLNRQDLPFYTLSGVIDLDGGMHDGAIPFYLKDNFEGIIEAGTPFLQIIPFKREKWEKHFNSELEEVGRKSNHLASRVFYGWYKKNIWQKKEYK